MACNVWKHLFLLGSPKSTQVKHEETCRPLLALKKGHALRSRLGYLRKRRHIYKKRRVLLQAANTLNIQKLQVFYLQRRNTRKEALNAKMLSSKNCEQAFICLRGIKFAIFTIFPSFLSCFVNSCISHQYTLASRLWKLKSLKQTVFISIIILLFLY